MLLAQLIKAVFLPLALLLVLLEELDLGLLLCRFNGLHIPRAMALAELSSLKVKCRVSHPHLLCRRVTVL
jgi:hypothetical protein